MDGALRGDGMTVEELLGWSLAQDDARLDQAGDRMTFSDIPASIRIADIYDGIPVASSPRREVYE